MVELDPPEIAVLEALADQPWMAPQQIARRLARSRGNTLFHLKKLLAQRMVLRVNPRSADFPVRAVYALSDRGLRALAEHARIEPLLYAQRLQLSRRRYVQLLWVLERVYSVRNLMLRLCGQDQTLGHFQVEVKERYILRGQERQVAIHGRACLVDGHEQMIPFVVEWELESVPAQPPHLVDLVLWQLDSRFYGSDRVPFPAVVVVVPTRERLVEFNEQLRQIARHHGMPLPETFLTLAPLLEREGPRARIWYSNRTGQWGTPFAGVEFQRITRHIFALAAATRRTAQVRIGTFHHRPLNAGSRPSQVDLLQFKLELLPQTKRVLVEIAAHPLLSVSELALLLEEHEKNVRLAAKRLLQWRLIAGREQAGTRYYFLARDGQRYLVAEAGYGWAVQRYARQRGWRRGLTRLLYHFEHTRVTNEFFLRWVRVARVRNAHFRWQSELSSRRYLREGRKLQAFFPDGLGHWSEARQNFRFAVEIDRSRESSANLRQKFEGYYALAGAEEQQKGTGAGLQVLVVTTSWARAETIRSVISDLARRRSAPPLNLWVTTFEELRTGELDAPVWRSTQSWGDLRSLQCF